MSKEAPGGRDLIASANDFARRQRERQERAAAEEQDRRKSHAEACARQEERRAAVARVVEAGRALFTSEKAQQQQGMKSSLAFMCDRLLPSRGATESDLIRWADATAGAGRLLREHEFEADYRAVDREQVLNHLASHTTHPNDDPAGHVPREDVAELLHIAWGLLDRVFTGTMESEVVTSLWAVVPVGVQFAHNIFVGLYGWRGGDEQEVCDGWSWIRSRFTTVEPRRLC